MKLILAKPQGFCAGVERAIKIVDNTIKLCGGNAVYVYHEIVHNKHVLDYFKNQGVSFVEDLNLVPNGSVVVFSAHGVSLEIKNKAKDKNLKVIDATCPLVEKVHKESQRNEAIGLEIIAIGHQDHPEIVGTVGSVKSHVRVISCVKEAMTIQVRDPSKLSYVTQTTLSVEDTREIISVLKDRFPLIKGPNLKDICFATHNRQNAVKKLVKLVDMLLVIGGKNSSNSNRLMELGRESGMPSYLINDSTEISSSWFHNTEHVVVGITSGASTPSISLKEVVDHLKLTYSAELTWLEAEEEKVKFPMPNLDVLANNYT